MHKQMPYPAWVLDVSWRPLMMNSAHERLLAMVRDELGGLPRNDLLFHPDGLRRCVVNWEELASMALRRLRREAALGHTGFEALLERCRHYPGIPQSWQHAVPSEAAHPVLRVVFDLAGSRLEFVTTLATFGTAVDVTGQDLRIENYFAADSATDAFCRQRLA
jgi:PAS domain-containing protein